MKLPNDPKSCLSDLLPALSNTGKNHSVFWGLPVNFSDSNYFSAVLQAIVERQEETLNIDAHLMECKTLSDIKHIAETRGAFDDNSAEYMLLSLIQIHLTYIPLRQHSIEKRLVDALTWIGYGLGDNFEQNLNESQLQTFYTDIGTLYAEYAGNLTPIVADWFGYFYYVWRGLGCDYKVGCSQIDAALHAFNRRLDVWDIDSWGNNIGYLVCWLAHYEHEESKSIVSHIEYVYNSSTLNEYISLRILEVLSTRAGRYSSKASRHWAKTALEKHHEAMVDFQRFIFLATVIHPDAPEDFEQFYPRFLDALRKTMGELLKTANDPIHEENRRSIVAESITPLLGNLIKMNKGEAALEVLLVWYGLDSKTLQNSVLVVGNDMNSLLACADNISLLSTERTKEEHQYLITSMSEFLGVSCSINGDVNFILNQPESGRFGVPSESKSDEYLKSIIAYYKLSELGGFIDTNDVKRMIFLPGEHHPIQYGLMKASKNCLPLSTSLTSPYDDRKINKICLISAANSMTEQFEITLLVSIFNQLLPQAEIVILASDNESKNDFMNVYRSNDYDLIWVMSHGEFDHWNPENVQMKMLNETVALDELVSIKIDPCREQRRLLFLNVCDGATSRSTGSISRIGFGPMLANERQCVASHLWPTHYLSALIFGAWFAFYLGKTGSFFNSYKYAVEGMMQNKEELIKKLNEIDVIAPDVMDRIASGNIDTTLLAHSGSVAFFE